MKKRLTLFLLLLAPPLVHAQIGEKFEPGFIIDKFGARYDGFLRLEPGDAKNPGELLFKESRKSKKETYGPEYLTAFKIEADSFTVLKNIPLPNKKTVKADFAKVVLAGSGGTLYFQEYVKSKTIGHAAADYKVTEENSRYLMSVNNKLIVLTHTNFKDLALVVADFEDLKARIQNRKVKFADLPKVVEEYKTFTVQKHSTQK
jgi:hypothetical protein